MGRTVGITMGATIALACLLAGPAAAWPFAQGDATLRPGDVIVTNETAYVVQADGALPAFDAPGAASPALRAMIAERLGPGHAAFWRAYAASRPRPARAPPSALALAPPTRLAAFAAVEVAPAFTGSLAPPRTGFATARAVARGGFVALN